MWPLATASCRAEPSRVHLLMSQPASSNKLQFTTYYMHQTDASPSLRVKRSETSACVTRSSLQCLIQHILCHQSSHWHQAERMLQQHQYNAPNHGQPALFALEVEMHIMDGIHDALHPTIKIGSNISNLHEIWCCLYCLWSPYGIGRPYIFSCCGLFFLLLFSSPNLSGRRLDVYHTLAHGVALVRI